MGELDVTLIWLLIGFFYKVLKTSITDSILLVKTVVLYTDSVSSDATWVVSRKQKLNTREVLFELEESPRTEGQGARSPSPPFTVCLPWVEVEDGKPSETRSFGKIRSEKC